MTIEAIGRFRRISKDLEAVSLQYIEELRAVWEKDPQAQETIKETREAISEIQSTLNILDTALNRLEYLRIKARRGRLTVVKGLVGKGEG